MDTDINFKDLSQIRSIIQNYLYNDSSAYKAFQQQAQQGFDYYDNNDKIKQTGAAAIDEVNAFLKLKGSNPLKSADNRISMNRHRTVVDQKAGYLFTVPPQFDLPSDDTDKGDEKLLKQVNDTVGTQWGKVIRQLGIDASNTGKAWLAYWQTQDGKFDYWYLNPQTIAPIYDRSTVKKKLKYLIRVYSFNDSTGKPATRYELWSDTQVAYLIKPEATAADTKPAIEYDTLPNGDWDIQPHTYGRIPFIEFQNNAKALPDLIMYKDIIDALDKLVSGFANDLDDIQEIIWVIKNYQGDKAAPVYDEKTGKQLTDGNGDPVMRPVDPLQLMKAKKWVGVDDKGGVDAIKGEIPYEARQAFRDILNDEFWTAAMAVNPNPPTAGNQSGVYIDYLYGLLELKSGLMETEFRSSIDEFLKAILHYLGADETKQFVQTWKRTKPQNNTEISSIIAQTPDTVVSEETKTKVHPLVTDWQAERAQIDKEQEKLKQDTQDNLEGLEKQHTEQQPNNKDGGAEK